MESTEEKKSNHNKMQHHVDESSCSNIDLNKKGNNVVTKLDIDAETSISSFVTLEQECNDVVSGLKVDQSLAKFRLEYEKLFHVLKKSHKQEKNLAEKCQELQNEIEGNASKMQNALQLSEKDKSTISLLKQDTERAWSLLDTAEKKESTISKSVDKLQEEVSKISSHLEKERSNNIKREEDFKNVTQQRDDLQLQCKEITEGSNIIGKELSSAHARIETLEKEYVETRRTNGNLMDEVNQRDGQIKREGIRSERVGKDIDDFKTKLQIKTREFIDLQYTSVLVSNKSTQLKKDLECTNKKMEERATEIEEQSHQIRHLSEALESQKDKISVIASDLHESRQAIKMSNAAHNRTSSEKSQIQRKFDNEHKVLLRLQQIVEDTKSSISSSQKEIQSLQKERDHFKQHEEQANRQICVLEKEKNMHIGKTQRSEQKVKQADEDAFHKEQVVLSLEKELSVAKEGGERLKQCIHHLEKKCGKYNDDVAEKCAALEEAKNKVQIHDVEVEEIKKQSQQWEIRFKEEKQICNNLRSERGKASRQTVEAQKEANKLKEQSSALSNEMKHLRSELLSKDESLIKEHFDHQKEEATKEQLNNEVARLKQQIHQQESIIQKQVTEIRRLCSTLRRMDEDMLAQKKEYDEVINERDILGAQLIRQNDELALLHEKVKIQENTLQKGEQQYLARLEDMQLLKLKIQDTQRKLDTVKGGSVNVDAMSKELLRKDKNLVHERVKVKALSEELENPLNVHRWRNLQGSDPTTFELIQKIELLQKRLIKKTEQVILYSAYIN